MARKSDKKVAEATGKAAKAAKAKDAKKAKKSEKAKKTEKAKGAKQQAKASATRERTALTGRGATPAEIGIDLVRLCNLGQSQEVVTKWYHRKIESIEGDGQVAKGLKALAAKYAWWEANHDVHAFSANGPFVGATGFSVRFDLSVTPKGGTRFDMAEIGVYTVRNGKIVREEFMYGA